MLQDPSKKRIYTKPVLKRKPGRQPLTPGEKAPKSTVSLPQATWDLLKDIGLKTTGFENASAGIRFVTDYYLKHSK